MTLHLPRRKFLTGAAALFCAPAIVRVSSLMKLPVRQKPQTWQWLVPSEPSYATEEIITWLRQANERIADMMSINSAFYGNGAAPAVEFGGIPVLLAKWMPKDNFALIPSQSSRDALKGNS